MKRERAGRVEKRAKAGVLKRERAGRVEKRAKAGRVEKRAGWAC